VSPTAIVLAGLVAAVVFLGLTLAGLVRTVDGLHRRLATMEASAPVQHPPAGLPVGAQAPAFDGRTARGSSFRSAALAGHRHVITFADPGCEACERLVPDLLSSAESGELPPCVVVIAGTDTGTWTGPRGAEDRAILLLDPEALVADAFGSGFTPHSFVVDEGGSVAAQGLASDVSAVRRLLREAEGVHILRSDAVEILDG
jgi:hypothetical protein